MGEQEEKEKPLLDGAPAEVDENGEPVETAESKRKGKMLLISFWLMVVIGLGNKIFQKLETRPMEHYPFFLNLWTTFFYIPISFAYIIPMIIWGKQITPEQRATKTWKFAVMGALDGSAGIMQVYAATFLPGPLLILLLQSAIPMSMLISKILVRATYKIYHYVGASVVTLGLVIALLPQFIGGNTAATAPAHPALPAHRFSLEQYATGVPHNFYYSWALTGNDSAPLLFPFNGTEDLSAKHGAPLSMLQVAMDGDSSELLTVHKGDAAMVLNNKTVVLESIKGIKSLAAMPSFFVWNGTYLFMGIAPVQPKPSHSSHSSSGAANHSHAGNSSGSSSPSSGSMEVLFASAAGGESGGASHGGPMFVKPLKKMALRKTPGNKEAATQGKHELEADTETEMLEVQSLSSVDNTPLLRMYEVLEFKPIAASPIAVKNHSAALALRERIMAAAKAAPLDNVTVVQNPAVLRLGGSEGGGDAPKKPEDCSILKWAAILVLSCIPMTLSSVFKEKALDEVDLDAIYVNGWVAVFQFLMSAILIPVDAIPRCGVSTPLLETFQAVLDGFMCYIGTNILWKGEDLCAGPDGLNGKGCCKLSPLYVNVYLVFNVAYNVLIILIIKFGSSNVLWIAMTIMVPMANLTFAIPGIPGYEPATWEDGLGLALIVGGLCVYRFYGDVKKLYLKLFGTKADVEKAEEEEGQYVPPKHYYGRADALDTAEYLLEHPEHREPVLHRPAAHIRSHLYSRLGLSAQGGNANANNASHANRSAGAAEAGHARSQPPVIRNSINASPTDSSNSTA